jgi:hypothetical protein
MDYNKNKILEIINIILLESQLSLKIARLLLEFVFVSWSNPENVLGEKHIRKFLITDFYQILCDKQVVYLEELKDYNKNADEHLSIQKKIKKICELGLLLQKKEFHDEIIYLMNILS